MIDTIIILLKGNFLFYFVNSGERLYNIHINILESVHVFFFV